MFIVDLECTTGHSFEGWYDTSAEYDALRESNDVTCPLCGTAEVHQVLSTGAIRTAKNASRREVAPLGPVASPPKMPLELQQQLAKVVQYVRRTHEDVGPAFTDTAIAIHEGQEPARPIRGEADEDGETRLRERGVPFVKLPVPDIEQN